MAGIIKSGKFQNRRGAVHPAVFNFEDMTQQADRYLENVRQQAASMIAEAKQQAAKIVQEAAEQMHESAVAEAEKRLQSQLAEKLSSVLPALQQAVQEIDRAKQGWINHWEGETVALAVAIAERIARREFSRTPEVRNELIREALQLAVGGGDFKLHLHPADCELVQPWLEQLASDGTEFVPGEVVADPEVSPGGCRVTTQFGSIDQTLEAQLARIEEELTA